MTWNSVYSKLIAVFLSTVQHLQLITRLNFCLLLKCGTFMFGNITIDLHRYMYNCIIFRWKVWVQSTRNETFMIYTHVRPKSKSGINAHVYHILCSFVWLDGLRQLEFFNFHFKHLHFVGLSGLFFKFLMLCLNLYFLFTTHVQYNCVYLSLSQCLFVYFVGRWVC